MKRISEVALIAALVAIGAAPRLPGLGRFTSLDEPFWLRQSANFYYALGQREFQNTLYEYHPAVTTMWIITAGMLIYFPEYRALGQGYLKPGQFDAFLPAHGKDPLQLLIVSRAVQVMVILVLLIVVYVLLRALFDRPTAFFATAFISLSPFFIGQSRLLNHEAMLALFSIISLLAILAYLSTKPRFALLLVSAGAAGLAQLTKSSGMPIIPLALLILLLNALRPGEQQAGRRLLSAGKTFGVWLALAAATYAIVWPGMWVAPLSMLQDVYGNAVSYTLEGARLSSLAGAGGGGITLRSLAAGIGLYLNDLAWRNTLLTDIGVLVAIVLAIRDLKTGSNPLQGWIVLYALLLAAAFVLLFGFQRGPKPPHYILTTYVCLDLIAALGLLRGLSVLARRFARLATPPFAASALALVLLFQAGSAFGSYPYYISYYNPIIEAVQPGIQNPTLSETGYGAGLDQAAAYLSRKPDAQDLVVMSANGAGCFSYYFPGRTIPMNDFVLSDPKVVEAAAESQYAVVDYYNQRRHNLAQDLEGVEPEATIWVNGIEFLHIYRIADLMAGASH